MHLIHLETHTETAKASRRGKSDSLRSLFYRLLKSGVGAGSVAKNPQRHKLLKGHWVAMPELLSAQGQRGSIQAGKAGHPKIWPFSIKKKCRGVERWLSS